MDESRNVVEGQFAWLIYPKDPDVITPDSYVCACYTPSHGKGKVTASGYGLPVAKNVTFRLFGDWEENKKYNRKEFKVRAYEDVVPANRNGIVNYLASGQIKGIGNVLAIRIYEKFGNNTLDILDKDINRLKEVHGIGETKLARIIESYQETRCARDLIVFLAQYNVTAKRAMAIYKEYGGNAIGLIKSNPYKLCEMVGIAFATADKIAIQTGFDPHSAARMEAAVIWTLVEQEHNGNLCVSTQDLAKMVQKAVGTWTAAEITAHIFDMAAKNAGITSYNGFVYRLVIAHAEDAVAQKLAKLMRMTVVPPTDIDSEIDAQESKTGMIFDAGQRNAIKMALSNPVCVITGGPGTGKTSIEKAILHIFEGAHPGAEIRCCAPTGKASKRMQEASGYEAHTIHSTLGIHDGIEKSDIEKLDADLIVVDEVSMLDINLADMLLHAVRMGAQLVMIGDADQLPSVGPGAVLSEMIKSGRVPVAKLETVHRQANGSLVAVNAQHIRKGEVCGFYDQNNQFWETVLEFDTGRGNTFQFVESNVEQSSAAFCNDIYLNEAHIYGINNVALLTPFKKEGYPAGAINMNLYIQNSYNPPAPDKKQISVGKHVLRVKDRVMQTANKTIGGTYVSNGETGYVQDIFKEDGSLFVSVLFDSGSYIKYGLDDLENLQLAYAFTIHKSQGSEYKSVIISLQNSYHVLLNRSLLYTAITRAKERVIIVGDRSAIKQAVLTLDTEVRGTQLADRIIRYTDM